MEIARLRAELAKGFIDKFFSHLMTIIAIAAIAVFTDRAENGIANYFSSAGVCRRFRIRNVSALY